MSAARLTRTLDSVTRWQAGTLDVLERGDIERAKLHSQISTWRETLLALRQELITREKAIITAESLAADQAMDRYDLAFAARTARDAVNSLQRLTEFAVNHASREERPRIDLDAMVLVDAIESLAVGVARPIQPNNPLKGA